MREFNVSEEGKLLQERWKWVTFSDDRGEVKLELFMPNSDEWLNFLTRFRLGGGSGKPKWKEAREFIARRWWRQTAGAKAKNGKDLPNEAKFRALMLLDSKDLLDFVIETFKMGSEEIAEGNEEGGTV